MDDYECGLKFIKTKEEYMNQLMYPECGGVGNEKWKEPFKRQRIAQAKFNPRAIYYANESLEEFGYDCKENQPNEIIKAVDRIENSLNGNTNGLDEIDALLKGKFVGKTENHYFLNNSNFKLLRSINMIRPAIGSQYSTRSEIESLTSTNF